MTEQEFLMLIRDCTLSTDDIAEGLDVDSSVIRSWRQGESFPPEYARKQIIREISMRELTRLGEEIQGWEQKRNHLSK